MTNLREIGGNDSVLWVELDRKDYANCPQENQGPIFLIKILKYLYLA